MPAGKITALSVQTGDRERVSIFIDGAFAIGISLLTLQRQGLYKGQVLTEEDWQQLEKAVSNERAWEAALRLLEVRPRAEREISDRLRRKGFLPEQIEGVIVRLRDLELLDDARFAKLWISNRAATKPKGALALQNELLGKGVDRQIASDAIAAATDPEREAAACEQVARQAARRYSSIEDWSSFQRKLGGVLQRRGFTWETVGPVLRLLWQERQQEDEEDTSQLEHDDEPGVNDEPE